METKPKHANGNKKKRTVVAAFLIGGLALGAGGVFAANSITINGDNTIEFGQGTAETQTCDASMETSLAQSWSNSDSFFKVDSVAISYTEGSCAGKKIQVSLLDASGNAICGISSVEIDGTLNTTGDTVNASGANCDASTVARVAVTTSN